MADLFNDFAINSIQVDSAISAEDYRARAYSGAQGGRQNLVQALAKYKNNNAAVANMKFPSITPKYYMMMNIMEYNRINLERVDASTVQQRIILPMPSNMIDMNNVAYTEENMGILLGTLLNEGANNYKSQMSNMDSMKDGFKFLGKLAADANQPDVSGLQTSRNIGGAAGLQVASVLGGAATRGALGLAGYSPNQWFTVLLIGPSYKRYNFTWIMIPQSKEESDAINKIILAINNAKAPGMTDNNLFWKFPKIFQLGYYPNTKYLYKFKPAVIESFSVSYAPNGSPAFYAASDDTSNAPEAVVLSAAFIELEYWLTGQYNDESSPFGEVQGGSGTDVIGPAS